MCGCVCLYVFVCVGDRKSHIVENESIQAYIDRYILIEKDIYVTRITICYIINYMYRIHTIRSTYYDSN